MAQDILSKGNVGIARRKTAETRETAEGRGLTKDGKLRPKK